MTAAGLLAAPLAGPAVRPLLVLVVDDEHFVRRVVCEVLELAGHTVVEATSANEALGVARDGRRAIDVLVTDLALPGVEGPELAELLLCTLPGLGIVFASGFSDDAELTERFPGSVFLQKPFTVQALAAAVATAGH